MRRAILCLAMAAFAGVNGCVSSDTSPVTGALPSDAHITEAKDPEITAETRYAAGQLAESTGDAGRAITQYRLALQLDPKDAKSLFRIGVLQSQNKEFAAAIETWKHYLDITDHAAAGWANLGFCYELSNQPNLAEMAYEKGIEKDGNNMACRVNYGLMLARTGRSDEAIKQFAVVLSPAESHYNLGSVFEQTGKKAQAKLEYTRALECDPTMSDAQQRLASLDGN